MCLAKTWTAIDRLLIIWKSDLSDKMQWLFQFYYMDAPRIEKKLNGNCTRMQNAILNKATSQETTVIRPPISKTIQIRRTRHVKHCWRTKDEFISVVLQWAPSHPCASVGRPTGTYLQQLCTDTGCSLEDLLGAMVRGTRREKVRGIPISTYFGQLHILIFGL